MKRRIYIDTSIVGGYFDEEFQKETCQIFSQFEKGEIVFVISDLLELELTRAPQHVKELFLKYTPETFEKITLTQEALNLADAYVKENVVGQTSLEDCRHIALGTIWKVDVLASWNFKHIVNLDKIKGYNSVNLRMGYQMLEIRSPFELIKYGDNQ